MDNTWENVIKQFWMQKVTDARTTQSDPNPLPNFTNAFDFSTIGYNHKRGWMQAYYIYQILKPEIQLKTILQQHALFF